MTLWTKSSILLVIAMAFTACAPASHGEPSAQLNSQAQPTSSPSQFDEAPSRKQTLFDSITTDSWTNTKPETKPVTPKKTTPTQTPTPATTLTAPSNSKPKAISDSEALETAEKTLLSWVSDQDLSKIKIPAESMYHTDENNFYVADLENSLEIKFTKALTQKSFLMMKGNVISSNDKDAEKLFATGYAMICEVTKASSQAIKPQVLQLVQEEVNDGKDFHMIDLQWTGKTGASVLTRCLSRQPIKLGDVRLTLKNLFAVSLNIPE